MQWSRGNNIDQAALSLRRAIGTIVLLLGWMLLAPAWAQNISDIPLSQLPPEAQQVLMVIKHGGPFAYPKDGSVFGNYQRGLPMKRRGFYREYTVPTPGARNRGTRRIISGDEPANVFYYTDDHYNSFKRIRE